MTDGRPHSQIVSFARRSGRLDPRRQRAWDSMADDFVIVPRRGESSTAVDPAYRFEPDTTYGRNGPLVVEIGSGTGDAIAHAAAENPGSNFLALEVWRPGIAATLTRIRAAGLSNIRLIQVDAANAVKTMLAPSSVDELWLFFPDPWHKRKHRKRRLVTTGFAEDVARVLKPAGVWRLATDWADYATQMRAVLTASTAFTVVEGMRFEGRPTTKFERKGTDVGREIHDFTATLSAD